VRIAVIGAGAVGAALGSLLWRAGEDVVLVGRAAHVAAIRAAGLNVEGVLGGFRAAPRAEELAASVVPAAQLVSAVVALHAEYRAPGLCVVHTDLDSRQVVERCAELIERKVSLKSPDKRVRVDVVGNAVAVSLLRPGEAFSIYAFDVAQTEPAAAG